MAAASPPRILIVTTMRDEGPFVLEWIAHHRALGVSDFLVFTNACSDGTDRLLDLLAPAGVVHCRQQPAPSDSPQWTALKAAWEHRLRAAADWIAVIDCDEFINLRPPLKTLGALLSHVGQADAVVLPWRLFGAAGQDRFEDVPITARFTRAAPQPCAYPVVASFFKTLFRNDDRIRGLGVHRPRAVQAEPLLWVDGSGRRLPAAVAQRPGRINLHGLPPATALVQLNHYSLRSAESFMIKRARGLPNRRDKPVDAAYWIERNLNTEEDTSILCHQAAMLEVRNALLALPGVADAHAGACARHRAAFRTMMRDRGEWQLFGRLLMASESVVPDPVRLRGFLELGRTADGP